MAKSNKTSSLLKILNLPADATAEKPEVSQPETTAEFAENIEKTESAKTPENANNDNHDVEPAKKNRRRKAIVKHMEIEKLLETRAENPALKAAPTEERDRIYVRAPGTCAERQIVSVPLLLINEQLGAAVERFNCCACDVCLRGITVGALDLMPPMYIRVVNAADEDEVNRLIREHRPEAIRVLARLCIASLTSSYHETIDS